MAYVGQPVPTTTYQQARGKIGDGKSVRVTVPPHSGPVEAGKLYEFGGFLGFAVRGETPIASLDPGLALADSDQPQVLILNIEQAEYETSKVDPSGDFEAGTLIYWDGEKLVEDGGRPAGRVTSSKDGNNVIHMILGPQVFDEGAGGEVEG